MTLVNSIIACGPIVADTERAAAFYGHTLGLQFYRLESDYRGTEELDGITHFGIVPLKQAARLCFGADQWPSEVRLPQASIDFGVTDVATAAAELRAAGHQLLESSGDRRVVRLFSPDGLLVVLSEEALAH